MPITLFGIVARIISFFIPVKKNTWIFGSDYGREYREGSRFLLEYMLKEHPEIDCSFITRSAEVQDILGKKRIPCYLNFSVRGMIKIAQADVVFTTQSSTDILFVYKKKNRNFIFLSHGQPYKAVWLATPTEYKEKHFKEEKPIKKIGEKIAKFFNYGYEYWESSFYTSTSEYLIPYNKMYYGASSQIKILGMPRNDILFNPEKMASEKWLPDLMNKTIITYMPTHRNYGEGALSPIPFSNNDDAKVWLKANNIILLVKQHPNMVAKIEQETQDGVIIDITKKGIDPQVCLYYSDALITDYSSVWMDYLILERPLLFYYYDKYENDDTGVLYDIRKDPPGVFCYSEQELLANFIKLKDDYDSMRPSSRIVSKYHKYLDGNSCERYYKEVINWK